MITCSVIPTLGCVMIEMIIRIILSLAIIELAVPLANVNASGLGSFSYINFEGGGYYALHRYTHYYIPHNYSLFCPRKRSCE
jgi:hypothetical protein